MSDTPTPAAAPNVSVGSFGLNWGRALEKRNIDLFSAEQAPVEPVSVTKIEKAIKEMLPGSIAKIALKSLGLAQAPNEQAKTSAKPVELPAPLPLELCARVARECPELSRAFKAVTIGVGSRGFTLPVTDPEASELMGEDVKLEQEDLEAFLKHLCPNRSFTQLMKLTVSARKRFAFAAWEILRNELNNPVGVNPIEDGKTVKWCLADAEFTQIKRVIRVGKTRTETLTEHRRFRRFKQVTRTGFGFANKTTYFKEFGDPRPLNKETGEYWTTGPVPANFPAATELLIFADVDADGEHPTPEWLPILPDALASRAIRIINLDTLDNGATPPFLVIIEGTVNEAKLKQIEDQFKDIQGETSRRRAVFVQIDSEGVGSGINKEVVTGRIRIEPLAQLMTTEGMFLKYLAFLEKSIASALRLPLLLVGNIDSTLNRATAEAALVFAEDQVFGPERQDIEDVLNDVFLPECVMFSRLLSNEKGLRYHRVKLGGYNADRTADYLKLLSAEKGAMSLNERRAVVDTIVTDQKLPVIENAQANDPWALIEQTLKKPLTPLPNNASVSNQMKAELATQIGCSPDAIKAVAFYNSTYQEAA